MFKLKENCHEIIPQRTNILLKYTKESDQHVCVQRKRSGGGKMFSGAKKVRRTFKFAETLVNHARKIRPVIR